VFGRRLRSRVDVGTVDHVLQLDDLGYHVLAIVRAPLSSQPDCAKWLPAEGLPVERFFYELPRGSRVGGSDEPGSADRL